MTNPIDQGLTHFPIPVAVFTEAVSTFSEAETKLTLVNLFKLSVTMDAKYRQLIKEKWGIR